MSLGLVDAIILIVIILGGVVGFKKGAVKTLTQFIGLFIVILISFALKDKLMVLLYTNLPFFSFFGIFKGVEAANILLYQLISFMIIFASLMFILKVLLVITGLVEYLLKLTIFLSIPSKLLGIVAGVLEYYTYVFIALFILTLPIFHLNIVSESKVGTSILKNTPILSSMTNNTVEVYNDVWSIVKDKDTKTNSEINTLLLATMLDNHLISLESAKYLVKTNKIPIEDKSILNNYNGDMNFYNYVKEAYNGFN